MSTKTNDERLKILKERLTEIKEKKAGLSNPRKPKAEAEVTKVETTQEREPQSLNWLKYVAIIGAIGYASFYIYQNMDTETVISEKSKITEKAEIIEEPLKYNSEIRGHNIIISTTFKDESSVKIMKKELIERGFKANYFFLPEKSNSKEEVYKIFIGPYENEEEKSQWAKNLKIDFEILIP